MDAVLCINKPPGLTSFAAVSRVRRLCRVRRAGHAGTLDPLADGVLLVLTGQATRVARYLEELPKEYRATVRLGLETDTYDLGGRVTAERPVPALDRAAVEAVLVRFTGDIEQVPPMYSALKRDGQPLYKLARQGIEVPRAPRPVTVHRLALDGVDGRDLSLAVRCSKGTYIRSLASDVGRALGCGGAVARLTRTAVGPFTLDRAVDLAAATPEQLARCATGINAALAFLPEVALTDEQARAVRHGNAVAVPHRPERPVRLVRDGALLAIGRPGGAGTVQPDVVFTA
ncbi:MAG: tRNA pseudouridine(55) synthase TruB [Candidatus Edwardsbacteria bacterium]|jgi:tRNA pseudouridine55 synthase|nr:tRNA pseudouridine(55) synthase TruB [Candidatus Edwardsbacteria bacterium]